MSKPVKKIVMFFRGGLFPVNMGSRRYMVGLAKYLNSRPDVELTLVSMGSPADQFDRGRYLKIAKRIEFIPVPRRFGFFDLLNKILSRVGFDMFSSVFTALAVRRRFNEICKNADRIIINYAVWYNLLPRQIRRKKCVVITHDLVYYRRASFGGTDTVWKRMMVALNRLLELRVLDSYARVGVLGDYEKDELLRCGFEGSRIIHTRFPMEVKVGCANQPKVYDFVFLGGGDVDQSVQAMKMFLGRIATLVAPRKISLVVTRCETWDWSVFEIPPNVKLVKVGFVEDLSNLLSLTRLGVGTIPFGSGVKTKVVESMMSNLPVVATDHALEGVPADSSAFINIDHASDDEIRRWVVGMLDNDASSRAVGSKNGERLRALFAPEKCLSELCEWLLVDESLENQKEMS